MKIDKLYSAVCFGEVLWDIFPNRKNIGGAPLNVALRLHSFGVNPNIISRIGSDKNGNQLLQYLDDSSIDVSAIQLDKINKTGCVTVTLDATGSASYEIDYPAAWDKIEIVKKDIETVKSSDAFIFGSLACRDKVSKNTLLHLLQYAPFKVFDLNLRSPFYSIDLLVSLMNTSDLIKCNEDELVEICRALNFKSSSVKDQINFLSQHTHTNQICVTKGKNGAVLLYNNQMYDNNGYPVKVTDTVGAGDSFLAALISKLLDKTEPDQALNYACAVGALVASKKGANPTLDNSEILATITS